MSDREAERQSCWAVAEEMLAGEEYGSQLSRTEAWQRACKEIESLRAELAESVKDVSDADDRCGDALARAEKAERERDEAKATLETTLTNDLKRIQELQSGLAASVERSDLVVSDNTKLRAALDAADRMRVVAGRGIEKLSPSAIPIIELYDKARAAVGKAGGAMRSKPPTNAARATRVQPKKDSTKRSLTNSI